MGDDGAAGLLSLKRAGGTTIIQQESSCLIWGMPKAAQQIGAASYELTPDDIGRTMAKFRA
jgi:two-component system chemotaxis response regulator CheB